ncbi:MAG: DNA primase [Pontixanthobacter sp.]
MALSPQWLDELRARVTLSSVIMRTTKLQKAGHEWKACCPFHDEKSPSFTVSDQKGFYHCFGCGAHGDVIRWMTDQRGLQFMDAVKELAAEAGMEMPAPDPRAAKRAEQRAGLHEIMQSAQDWFAANLQSDSGSGARDYLATRGFSAHTMERFGFGYAPPERQAIQTALSQYDDALLIEGGLRIAVDEKEPYDRFRSRLMLPIHDARGRVIAFGGRILEADTKAPKYLNSPDTPLFDKGRTLYNLHRAGPASRQTNRLVVVEGYMDVIALADAGIEDAVAPLGTALTETQIELLWRMVDTPILCFDGDAAGQRAAKRAIDRALPNLQPNKSLAIVSLPSGMDPDDLIRKHGKGSFAELIATPTPLIDAIWEIERYATALDTPEQKAGLKARLIEYIELIGDDTIRALYRRHLFDLYFQFAFPKRQGNFKPGKGFTEPLRQDVSQSLRQFVDGGGRQSLSRSVLAGFARHPHLILKYLDLLWKVKPQDTGYAEGLELLDAAAIMLEEGERPPEMLSEMATWSKASSLPFLNRTASADHVEGSLVEALRLLVEKPLLTEALQRANASYIENMCEDTERDQRLARKQLEDFDSERKEFWRKWVDEMA